MDPAAAGLAERARSLAAEAAELARDVRDYREALAADPARLQEVRERVAGVEGAARKYGETDADVLAFLAEASGAPREPDARRRPARRARRPRLRALEHEAGERAATVTPGPARGRARPGRGARRRARGTGDAGRRRARSALDALAGARPVGRRAGRAPVLGGTRAVGPAAREGRIGGRALPHDARVPERPRRPRRRADARLRRGRRGDRRARPASRSDGGSRGSRVIARCSW